jgi:hypothetical protein
MHWAMHFLNASTPHVSVGAEGHPGTGGGKGSTAGGGAGHVGARGEGVVTMCCTVPPIQSGRVVIMSHLLYIIYHQAVIRPSVIAQSE